MSKFNTCPQRWILLRGLTRSHFHWFDFKNQLKTELNINSVDSPELPGNGHFSEFQTPTTLIQSVHALKKQVNAISEPVGLIGISLGGIIATEWAHHYPQDIGQLVLINTSSTISPFYHRLKPKNYFKIFCAINSGSAEKIEDYILKTTCNSQNWQSHLQTCIDFQRQHPVGFINLLRQLKLAQQASMNTKPDCNTLILTSLNDRLVNYKCSLEIASQWGLEAKIHPTAGHDLTMDDPHWVIQQIRNFITPE